jgi:hypothetical protein
MMILRTTTLSAVALCFATSLVLADEVFYCTDTAMVGFFFDRTTGKGEIATFTPSRYIMKIISDTKRDIVKDDTGGVSFSYTCHPPVAFSAEDRIICEDPFQGGTPWVFYKNNFTHAFLAGTPVGSYDRIIMVAYGTCARF